MSIDYQAAYERQKLARERAENLLEDRSRELYEANQSLQQTYDALKEQQEQLVHQEKLASLGQLAAGVAHEINNPAGYVRSNLNTLKQYVDDLLVVLSAYREHAQQQGVPDTLQQIEDDNDLDFLLEDLPTLLSDSIDGTFRISEIVDSLKNFSRIDDAKMQKLDVNSCIESTIKLINNEVKYNAELQVNLEPLPETMGFPGSLGQIFLNLIVNASHAIAKKGQHGLIQIHSYLDQSSGDILIDIQDNGCGMDEDTKRKVFDAFFTTKEVGVGTGLGLSISKGIVDKHNGKLTVKSELGEGSCFTIRLPIIDLPS